MSCILGMAALSPNAHSGDLANRNASNVVTELLPISNLSTFHFKLYPTATGRGCTLITIGKEIFY